MIEVENSTLEEVDLHDVPEFYSSISGNPYITRASDNVDVSTNVFKVVDVVEFDLSVDEFGFGTYEHKHNLGYRVSVEGSFYIKKIISSSGTPYPLNLRGQVPSFRKTNYGSTGYMKVYIASTTSTSFVVAADVGGFEGTLAIKAYLLREPIV
jgi:hypothetical protein